MIPEIGIPFTAYVKVIPDRTYNHRRTFTRSLEKLAEFVARDITLYLESNPSRFHINETKYVLSTPQFAQYPSRLTITGWDNPTTAPSQPATQVTVDAPYTTAGDDNYDGEPGRTVSGYMGTQYLHPQGQTWDSDLLTAVAAFKADLESASPIISGNVLRIDYMGATFGETGHTFP
jgi:hypothetical protein